jgi:hypothetical protein
MKNLWLFKISTFRFLCLTSPFLVFSCGDMKKNENKAGAGGAVAQAPFAMTVASESELPTCDETLQNQLAFSVEGEKFLLCKEGAWTVVLDPSESIAGLKKPLIEVKDLGLGCKELSTGNDTDSDGILTESDENYTKQILCSNDGKGPAQQAFEVYQTYRRSIFRFNVTCSYATGLPASRSSAGSGFRCGENKICTAGHVLTCYDPQNDRDGTLSNVSVRFVNTGSDSDSTANVLVSENSPTVAKASACSDLKFVYYNPSAMEHCVDLSQLIVNPAIFDDDMPVMTLTSQKPSAQCASEAAGCVPFPAALTPVLSMSFPLGFEELYSDLGSVNSNNIKDCGTSGFECRWLDFSTNNVTDGGSSGSPLIDVASGEVIGVLVSGTTPNENANYSWAIGAWMYGDTF